MPVKRVILVAGIDYYFKGVNFRTICNNRLKRLILANRAKGEMTATIFDCRSGEVVTYEITYPKGKKAEKVTVLTPSPFKKVSRDANFNPPDKAKGHESYHLKDGQRGLLSVTDVYSAVRKIGADEPGTLVELSFFSHGFWGGPVLYNSDDDGRVTVTTAGTRTEIEIPSGARDPDDFDPRVKDFMVMTAAQVTEFRKAFHTSGLIWSWGCAFSASVNTILHKIEHNGAYKDSGLSGEEIFKFTNFTAAEADYLESWIKDEIGGPFPDKKKIEIRFKFLKHFVCQTLQATYSHHIAEAANVRTFGALMGTYADYDKGTAMPLMSVEKMFGRHLKFYKNYLGLTFDPEGRGYGEYKPGFTCTPPAP